MKRIAKGEIYEVIPDTNGLIFVAFSEPRPDQTVNVTFSMLNFENDIITEVHRDVYKYLKFGANCKKIIEKCDNYVKCRAISLSEGKMFTVNTDGTAFLFDGDGEVMWTGQLKYKNKVPADIAVCGDGLWGCFSELDCLVRFNAATMREELRLGKKGEIFNGPGKLFVEDSSIYVASTAGKKVIRLDIPSYKVTEKYAFNEPVYSYVRAKNREFIITGSGLYEI